MKRTALVLAFALGTAGSATGDQVILDDLIVDGSACIGFDCVNGESFGFDTLRLKENNLRIKFQDTSSSASFPSNDWQITVNDSSNGGANKFSIDDIDGGRTPFTIEAGAPSDSLYVDDGGRLGLGTSTPVVDVHVKSGNTPTLRLEQDGSQGFTPQTWDVAGNEANFFIRDATNGSTLPFRIFPGAPSNAINIEAGTGDIGLGTTTPGNALHLSRTSDPRMSFENTADGVRWDTGIVDIAGGENNTFIISILGSGGAEMELTPTGVFTVGPGGVDNLTMDTTGNVTIMGMLTQLSDMNAKTDIEAVEGEAVLDRLAALPVSTWRYKKSAAEDRHMGPMAQDFHAAFGLGTDDTHISSLDMAGAAIVGVKELRSQLIEKDARIEALETYLLQLDARLGAAEQAVQQLRSAGR